MLDQFCHASIRIKDHCLKETNGILLAKVCEKTCCKEESKNTGKKRITFLTFWEIYVSQ